MSAVREVMETKELPFERKGKFSTLLPEQFLRHETKRESVESLWNENVTKSINKVLKNRKSMNTSKELKRTVFINGMEKILLDFNRKTDNIKVSFNVKEKEITNKTSRGKSIETYALEVYRLTPIPEDVRNARQYCSAEIPEREAEARAEFVGNEGEVDEDIPALVIPRISESHHGVLENTENDEPSSSLGDVPTVTAVLADSSDNTILALATANCEPINAETSDSTQVPTIAEVYQYPGL